MNARTVVGSKIIDACLRMNTSGLNQGTSGNVSVRFGEGMLITPSGIAYDKLTENQLVFIDGPGRAEQGKLPSSEWRFHRAVYDVRPELNAVVHTHSVQATAIAILNRDIPAIHYMIAATGANHIPCVPYATYGTAELSRYVAEGIAHSKAILLQHHGMIVAENNLEKALWLAQEVNVLADLYLKLLPMGDVPILSDEEIDRVIDKFADYGLRNE